MAETTQAPAVRIERWQDGDEQGILALFTEVFGRARSLEHWRWQFRDNPHGGPFVTVAKRAGDDAIVASYSVMPVTLNVAGRPVRICQSVDTAVHPSFRGQRLFEKTAAECYAWCESAGIEAVMGFPNASSYPGFVRSLGWKRIVFPTQHVLRFGFGAGLRRALGVPLLADALGGVVRLGAALQLEGRRLALAPLLRGGRRFAASGETPADYDTLWKEWRSQEMLSLWKDADYLRWRYDRNPDHAFTHFTLHVDGRLAAHAVGVELDGALTLCELMVRGRDVPLGRAFVLDIARHAMARGLRAVSFLGHDAGWFEDALWGFERQRSYGNVFGGRAFASGTLGELLPLPGNWTLTFGDGDFV